QGERSNHSLQATALVHEAYLRLVDQTVAGWQDRAHFIGLSAHLMREILVNHALAKKRLKRGGGQPLISIEDVGDVSLNTHVDLSALDEALTALEKLDVRQSQIVELRFFGGLSIEEIAEVLHISTATVKREWRSARAWLRSRINTNT